MIIKYIALITQPSYRFLNGHTVFSNGGRLRWRSDPLQQLLIPYSSLLTYNKSTYFTFYM